MSGNNKCKTIEIVGGTYMESCSEPEWEQIFGSGLRAALAVKGIDPKCRVTFHTIAESYIKQHLEMDYDDISMDIVEAPKGTSPISFIYRNALSSPIVYSNNNVDYPAVSVQAKKCIMFGMMETSGVVNADYVVYDPQSPNSPIPFSNTGSKANHLCVVLNEQEAQTWTGKKTDEEIRDVIWESEKCECLIIKKGAFGAIVYDKPDSRGIPIPAYKTNNVWTIGSGDVFTAALGYYWMIASKTIEQSAKLASLVVACYSNSKTLEKLGDLMKLAHFEEHFPKEKGEVYLAGPFFTMSERAFIKDCRDALVGMGLSVFSPFHDVGLGGPDEVVPQDIEAIKKCKTIFAVLDGMDSGTVFEVGYGVALGKRIIILAENESKMHLQMMLGTHCCVEKDFVTAIYKTCWMTYE